jgi:ankyrin repeat protein
MEIAPLSSRPSLDDHKKEAKAFLDAFKSGDPGAMRLVKRYNPRLPGRADTNDRNGVTEAEVRRVKLSLADAEHVIARGHQFESWAQFAKHIAALNRKNSAVWQFETAVEAIISGDVVTLQGLLRANPELIRARSPREHGATLLHYVGANAVEDYRQKTPKNAVKVAQLLIKAGAEVDADLGYGPEMRQRYPERMGSTTLGMVATSVWPVISGVQIPLMKVLIDAGAAVDGLPGKWKPVIAALHNGRGQAAEYLAKHGAKLDLEGAAGTGRLEAVKSFFRKDGSLKATATHEQLELGLAWACEYGHARVVSFLLRNGVNIAAQPHGETGLHWAAYGGYPGIVKMFLLRDAPLDVKDKRFDGTPLGWALYGWCNPPPEKKCRDYHEVVALLVAAGATVDSEWLASADRDTPFAEKLRADPRMLAALDGNRSASAITPRTLLQSRRARKR